MEFECLTVDFSNKTNDFCEVLCGPNAMCGPDYGVGCMPECDLAEDW